MKTKTLLYLASSKGAMVVPGIFKVSGADSDYINPVVVLNQNPNDKLSDAGGWNFMFSEEETEGEVTTTVLKVSKKLNPLYNANEDPSPRPEIPQYVPANFRTIEEALVALDAGKNIHEA